MKDRMKVAAGRIGGLARNARYGSPGTPEGRRLGGLRSQDFHRKHKTRFRTLEKIRKPRHSDRLAELMGILAGDGHLGVYQVSVTTSSETDLEHARYIQTLMSDLFKRPVSLIKRRKCAAVIVLLSSKAACDFLEEQGMSRGNKTSNQLGPPLWVLMKSSYRKAYLRGLMDTDGTVYLDKHRNKGVEYASLCLAFTNASRPLTDFVQATWQEMGYHPTTWGRHVRLRRGKEVRGYIKEVGFSNPKHMRKTEV